MEQPVKITSQIRNLEQDYKAAVDNFVQSVKTALEEWKTQTEDDTFKPIIRDIHRQKSAKGAYSVEAVIESYDETSDRGMRIELFFQQSGTAHSYTTLCEKKVDRYIPLHGFSYARYEGTAQEVLDDFASKTRLYIGFIKNSTVPNSAVEKTEI